MSMITATSWVPRGCAAEFPQKYDFSEEEFERISKLAKLQLEDANEDLQAAQTQQSKKSRTTAAPLHTNGEIDDDLREYDLDNYDEADEQSDDDGQEDEAMQGAEGTGESRSTSNTAGMGMFGNVKNLVYHGSNDDDPYITLKDGEDSDSEREELQILPSDNLILATKVEDDVAHLEVYVYEDAEDNLYVHHDLMLPAIPLTVEYINCFNGVSGDATSQNSHKARNLVAIGTMDPEIELWDLDLVDAVYPYAILGPPPTSESTRKKKKRKTPRPHSDYHTDSVLSLASNPAHRNLLASASADTTVKLWDLNSASSSGTSCAASYTYHTDKVCSLSWHPTESTALLSGSYDKSVIAADMRVSQKASSNGADGNRRRWTVESDIESVKWNPHNPNTFFVATEAGMLHNFDARQTPSSTTSLSKPLWTLAAHDAPLSAFDINPHIPGYMATGSADKTVKLWRMPNAAASAEASGTNAETGPTLITTRQAQSGRIFGLAFAPDSEVTFRLAVAGSKGSLQVWDTSTNAAVRRAFASPESTSEGAGDESKSEKVIRLAQDDDEDDDDEEENNENGGVGLVRHKQDDSDD